MRNNCNNTIPPLFPHFSVFTRVVSLSFACLALICLFFGLVDLHFGMFWFVLPPLFAPLRDPKQKFYSFTKETEQPKQFRVSVSFSSKPKQNKRVSQDTLEQKDK
jgi:hypothetical protein